MKVRIPGIILAEPTRYAEVGENIVNNMRFSHFPFENWRGSDRVCVIPHTVEVDIPDNFDPRAGLIENLKRQETSAMAEFQKLVTSIRRQIGELEALEMS